MSEIGNARALVARMVIEDQQQSARDADARREAVHVTEKAAIAAEGEIKSVTDTSQKYEWVATAASAVSQVKSAGKAFAAKPEQAAQMTAGMQGGGATKSGAGMKMGGGMREGITKAIREQLQMDDEADRCQAASAKAIASAAAGLKQMEKQIARGDREVAQQALRG